ncbi:hypothetical protein ACFL20_11160 [Spirochaetota bacterium]
MKKLFILLLLFSIAVLPLSAEEEKHKSEVKFVPAIAFVLDISTVYRNFENEEFGSLGIPGFIHGHGHDDDGHGHAGLNAKRGFNLNYGELQIGGEVDKYFKLHAAFHISTTSFDIEEAFVETSFLPFGFEIKLGKFLGSFGILSSKDPHNWDFADQALVYSVFFGEHGINELGAQILWKAPIHMNLVIGAEILEGKNEMSFNTEEIVGYNDTIEIEGSNEPNLYVGFIKSSIKVDHFEFLYGFSVAYGWTRMNAGLDDDNSSGEERHAVDAKTYILGGDLTVKYHLGSEKYISLQNELIYRNTRGDEHALDIDNSLSTESFSRKQWGLYSQLIVKPLEQWRFGLRFDLLQMNEIKVGGVKEDVPENLYKISAMSEFHPTHNSRIRLQYNFDRSKYLEDTRKSNHEVILQFTMIVGAHEEHGEEEDHDDHDEKDKH